MPKKYDPEVKARAVRMVPDHLSTYGSVTATAAAVGPQLGISENMLRRWVNQDDVDAGRREGVPSDVQGELARLTAENKRLRETNEILRRGGCRTNLRRTVGVAVGSAPGVAGRCCRELQLRDGRS